MSKNKRLMTSKQFKKIAILIAIVLIVVAISFGASKFLLGKEVNNIELYFQNYTIEETCIATTPAQTEYTGDGVTVTLTVPEKPGVKVQYQLVHRDGREDSWLDYETPFFLKENATVNVKYVGVTEEFDGPVTSADITNIGVAKIETGDTTEYYVTLQDAINAVGDTQTTITIIANANSSDITGNIPEGKDIILDLNGYTISSDKTVIRNDGIITIKNGEIIANNHAIENNKGNIEINNVKITSQTGDGIHATTTGNVVVTGGTITGATNGIFSQGKLIVGNNNDEKIASQESPIIIGTKTGINFEGTEFEYYDGIIKSEGNQAINGTPTKTAEGYSVANGTDETEEATYQTAYLDNHYTITFDANGGTLPTKEKTVEYGKTYGELDTPEKTGYSFIGWEIKEGTTETTIVDHDTTVALAQNHTLVAKCEANSYTVTYDYGTNGGQISESDNEQTLTEKVDYNSPINVSQTGYKENYELIGWNTDANQTVALESLTMETSDVTLYAIYKKNVTIVYDKNGGDEDRIQTDLEMYNNNTSLTITMPEPTTNENWQFQGYGETNTEKSGLEQGTEQTITVPINQKTITYYHTWKKQVQFNGNAPSNVYPLTINEQARDIYYNNGFGSLPEDPTITGWQFDGWYTAEQDGTQITEETLAQDIPETIYAHWTSTATMEVTPEKLVLDITENQTEQITIAGSGYGEVTYASSDPIKVSVDENGLITAHQNTDEPVTITVKGSNGNITKTITVEAKTSPQSITVASETATIGVSSSNTTQLTYTLNAVDENGDPILVNTNSDITWSSDNETIATVDSNGVVTGKEDGTVTITATTENGCTSEVTIIVDKKAPTIQVTMDNSDYKKSHKATITITDDVAGLPESQTISYAWSTSQDQAPTTWETATISVTAGEKSASQTIEKTDGDGIYYLWVKSGIEDRFNNQTTTNYVDGADSGKAKMDNTAPVIAKKGNTNTTKASASSTLVIPLQITETHSGLKTDNSAEAFTIDDIQVLVAGQPATFAQGNLTFNSEEDGVYSYTLRLKGVEGTGEITLKISEGKVKDNAGSQANNGNENAEVTIDTGITMDGEAFNCEINTNETSPTNKSEITYTFTFNKDVKGETFTTDDITVTNGDVKSLTKVNNNTYEVVITNTETCTQKVGLKTGSVQDAFGNNIEATEEFVMQIDKTAPTAWINTESMYVTDGLVTRLDGVNNANGSHSASATIWSDISGNNKDGEITDGTWGDKYLEFNDSTSWVNLGVMNQTEQTLDVTFSVAEIKSYPQCIMGNPQKAGGGLYVLSTGEIRGGYWLDGDYKWINSGVIAKPGQVYNVSIIINEGKEYLYVNGILCGSDSGTTLTQPTSTVMALGGNPVESELSSIEKFYGKIYTAAVYNKALTAEQVLQNAQAGKALAGGPTNAENITYTIRFSEKVTGFTTEDIKITNGTKGEFKQVTEGKVYNVVATTDANQNSTQKIEFVANCCTDIAGNGISATSKNVVIDRIAPTVELTTNGGTYTITPGSTEPQVSTTPTVTETGSGIAGQSYAWTTNSSTQPSKWTSFTSGTEITKSLSGGNHYLWTNVIDNAGNRATTIQKSEAFTVKYQVVFNSNNGTGAPDAQSKVHGTTLVLSTTQPTRAGYTFKEWNTEDNGSGTSYAPGAIYKDDTAVTLYAQWIVNTYTISYTLNSGKVSNANPTSYNVTSSAITLNNPTRTGYTFNGWTEQITGLTWTAGFIDQDTGAIKTSSIYPNAYYSDLIYLDANKTYTLSNYGSYDGFRFRVYDTNYSYLGNKSLINSYKPTSACYVRILYFNSSTEAQRSGTIITSGTKDKTEIIQTGSTGNRKFTANWTANNYTITYDYNEPHNHATTKENKTLAYGTQLGTLPNPTESGYTLNGWFTEPTGGTRISSTTTVKGDKTYYAQWTPNTDTPYVVNHYVHDLGEDTYTLNSTDNLTGTTDASLTVANLKQEIPGFTYEDGYTTGNTTKPSSSDAVTTTTILPNGTRVINLYYRRNRLYIQYHINGGTFSSNNTACGTSNSLVTRNSNDSDTSKTKFLMGYYGSTVNSVTNTYKYILAANGLHDYNNPNAINISKTGYSAKSGAEWNTKDDGTGISYNQATTTYSADNFGGKDLSIGDQTVVLYVNWTPNKYKVTLDNQSATTAGTAEYWYKYNTTTTVDGTTIYYYKDEAMSSGPMKGSTITKPEKTGYTFGGYYTGKNGTGTQYINANGKCINSIYKVAENTTLYANWTPNTYNITYDLDGGSVSTANPTTYKVTTNTITLNNPTKTGYTFNGWTEQITGLTWTAGFIDQDTGAIKTSSIYPNAYYSDLIYLDANKTYTLSNYGSYDGFRFRVYDTNYSYLGNKSLINSYKPTSACYVRILYYNSSTEAQRSGTIITSGTKNTTEIIQTGSTGNRKFTANWTANKYNITFDYNRQTNYLFEEHLENAYAYGCWSGLKSGDKLYITCEMSYTDIVPKTGQSASVCLAVFNLDNYSVRGRSASQEWYGSGTAKFDFTISVTDEMLADQYFMVSLWADTNNVQSGTVVTSNMKATRIPKETKTLAYGTKLGTLPTPTEDGYTFNGWYTAPTGGEKISSTTTVPAKDTTYYAQWIAKEAIFDTGTNVNVKMKTLSGQSNPSIESFNDSITLILPAAYIEDIYKTDYNKVSASNSPLPIYMWYDSGTIYWWSEASNLYLNADSSYMFARCDKLTALYVTPFNTSNVTNMASMFESCRSLTGLDVTKFDTSNVTNMRYMFGGCGSLTGLNVTKFDTSNVTDFALMFYECNQLTTLDVTNFNTSKATDMGNMFMGCRSLKELDVTKFDTSKVTDMSFMFFGCSKLTTLDVTKFNTSNVTTMYDMFRYCSSLTSLDVTKFDTSNVKGMSGMFRYCSSLTSIDLTNFNTSNVTSMEEMFEGCSSLTTIYVGSGWSTSAVASSANMFKDCTKLVGGAGTKYNASYTNDKAYACIDLGTLSTGYLTQGPPSTAKAASYSTKALSTLKSPKNENTDSNSLLNVEKNETIENIQNAEKDNALEVSQNTETTETVDDSKNIVQVGNISYPTLEEAISSASGGDTLKILEDINLTEEITINKGKNIKLDLNGKTITSTSINTITNNGTLTILSNGIIRNETDNGTVINNIGTLKIEKAVITTAKNGGKGINNEGKLEISGGKIVTEGIGANAIYNKAKSEMIMTAGIIEVRGFGSKGIYNNSSVVIDANADSAANSSTNSTTKLDTSQNTVKIVVSNDDSIGIYNSKEAKVCDIKSTEILIEADVIENYDLIKNTDEFKAELKQMKPSYGIYNDSNISVNIEEAVIKAERLKGIGIQNNSGGTIVLGKADEELNLANPIIYAIADNTTGIINSKTGEIGFYDGRIITTNSIKNIITKVLDNYEIKEDITADIITTTLKLITVEKTLSSDENNSDNSNLSVE